MSAGRGPDRPWWESAVVYQIYPRSFCDSDGDGVGDLEGIRRHLDHLTWLGVDALWLSPFFRSPMADFGYDVADYTDVDPLFGDLATFDQLLAEAHQRELKVLIDWVPNHSSDQHPWFQASPVVAPRPQTGLVLVARRPLRRRRGQRGARLPGTGTEQLAGGVPRRRWVRAAQRVDLGRGDRAVVPPPVSSPVSRT